MIDAEVTRPNHLKAAHVCGVMATLSLIMINSVSNAQVCLKTISMNFYDFLYESRSKFVPFDLSFYK